MILAVLANTYSIWFDTERLEFYAHSFHPSVIFLLDKFFTNELLKVKY